MLYSTLYTSTFFVIYLAHKIPDASMSSSGQYICQKFSYINSIYIYTLYTYNSIYINSICAFLIVIGTLKLDLLLVNNMKCVLFKFNDNLLILNQSFAFLNSLHTSIFSSFKSYLEYIYIWLHHLQIKYISIWRMHYIIH